MASRRHVEDLGSIHIRTGRLHPALPELVWVGHQRTASSAYGHRSRRRQPQLRAVQVTLAGAGVLGWQGQEQVVTAGSAFVYTPGDPAVSFHWSPDWAPLWEQLIVYVGGTVSHEMLDGLLAESGPVVALAADQPSVRDLLEPAHSGETERALPAGASAALAGALLADLCAARHRDAIRHGELLVLAERIACWMAEHLAEEITLAAMATALGTTQHYLHRACLQAYGLAPIAFLTRQRLRQAGCLLRRSDAPIASIATAIGYTPDAFSRAFRRHVGHTPLAYRAGDGGPVV